MKIFKNPVLVIFLIVFSFCLVFLFSSCQKDDDNPVTSSAEKENIKKAIDTAVSDFITPESFSTILVNVRIPSKEFEWSQGYSLKQPQSSEKIKERHFNISGTTDAFMAVLTMKLIEEKKLGLNDTLGLFFRNDSAKAYYKADPNLLDSICVYNGKSYGRQITVKMLLNHTSGIPEYDYGPDFTIYLVDNLTNMDKRHILSIAMKNRELTTEPGKYSFSKTNYTLLEMILENVTGNTIARLLRDYIYNTCGLTSTYFSLDEPLNKLKHTGNAGPELNKTNFAGCALGLYSTLGDINSFFTAFNSGRIINSSSAANILSFNLLGVDSTTNISVGYGIGLQHYSFNGINAYGIIQNPVVMLYVPAKKAYITAYISSGNTLAPYILFKKIAAAIP